MKKFLILLCVILIIAFFSINCFAQEIDDFDTNTLRNAVTSVRAREDSAKWNYYFVTYEPTVEQYVFYATKNKPYFGFGGELLFDGEYLYSYYDYDSNSFNVFNYSKNGLELPDYGWVEYSNFSLLDYDTGYSLEGSPEYFKPLEPLYSTIGGVTSSTLSNNTIPFIRGVFSVLVSVGVAILATFIVIKLIGRRSLINR